MRQITDILSLLKFLKNSKGNADVNLSPGKPKTIKSMASKSILQFPLLMSSNVSVKAAGDIAKSLEGEYATLLKVAMETQDTQYVKGKNVNTAKLDYIKQFHTNISTGGMVENVLGLSNDDGIDVSVELLGESKDSRFNGVNLSLLTPISEDVNTAILNDKFNIERVKVLSEADKGTGKGNRSNEDDKEFTKMSINERKINELAPLLINIEIRYLADGTNFEKTSITVGIKTVIHTIKSSEFMYFLPSAIKENNFVFRAIQFTTGEIRFVRDFILNVGRIKKQANADRNGKRVTKWWRTLSRMSNVNKIMGYFNKNKFLPSTTMIISMDDVENIKTNEGIDILTSDSANRLYKIYFLLGLIVVDEPNNTYYIFDEESSTFKTVPFSQIRKEAGAASDGSMKMLQNLLSIR